MRETITCICLIGSFCLGRFSVGWIAPAVLGSLALLWALLALLFDVTDDGDIYGRQLDHLCLPKRWRWKTPKTD